MVVVPEQFSITQGRPILTPSNKNLNSLSWTDATTRTRKSNPAYPCMAGNQTIQKPLSINPNLAVPAKPRYLILCFRFHIHIHFHIHFHIHIHRLAAVLINPVSSKTIKVETGLKTRLCNQDSMQLKNKTKWLGPHHNQKDNVLAPCPIPCDHSHASPVIIRLLSLIRRELPKESRSGRCSDFVITRDGRDWVCCVQVLGPGRPYRRSKQHEVNCIDEEWQAHRLQRLQVSRRCSEKSG